MLTKKESPKSEVKLNKTTKSSSQSLTPNEHVGNAAIKTVQQLAKPNTPPSPLTNETQTQKNPQAKTRLTIKYDAGYSNEIYIRGKGANLNWEKGQLLKNVKPDEWIWETDFAFNQCEFKVLINDRDYEQGNNHLLNNGASVVYTPHF